MVLAADDRRIIVRGAANLRPGLCLRGRGMRADPDGALLGASLASVGAAVSGSVVAVRN